MPIPTIEPYPMPTEDDLPAATVSWRLDPARAVLLVHDLQRYFVGMFPPGRSPVVELLANVARLRETAAAQGIPVVYTEQPGRLSRERRGLLYDFWGPGMGTDRAVRAIVPEVAPGPSDPVVRRHRYSAFYDTDLAGILRGYGRDQLIVCGVYAHIGCLFTAGDALARDIQAFLVADAVADFGPREHRMALAHAAGTCAAVTTTDRAVAALVPVVGTGAALLLDDAHQLHP